MLDITTIILTYNEELHIRRCLDNVVPLSKRVLVIDCQSTDKTCEICSEYHNVEVVQHKWPGNQAEQFNWAIDNISIDTEWILRIDADEYLLPELVEELQEKVPHLPADVTGVEFKRRHIFMDKWVKHGIYPVVLLRMYRNGYGRYEERLMDEHIRLSRGKTVVMENDFCDHSLISISDYCRKHINYAIREAAEYFMDEEYKVDGLANKAVEKRKEKKSYNKLPLFLRAFAYFTYRYILRGGFLDGRAGFVFAFIQGWWYRTMVDANIYEIIKKSGNNKDKIRLILKSDYGINI